MSVQNEISRHALREHRDLERATLERVQAEALSLERLPEGEEYDPVIVDGELITPNRRIRGKLTVRW